MPMRELDKNGVKNGTNVAMAQQKRSRPKLFRCTIKRAETRSSPVQTTTQKQIVMDLPNPSGNTRAEMGFPSLELGTVKILPQSPHVVPAVLWNGMKPRTAPFATRHFGNLHRWGGPDPSAIFTEIHR